MRTYSDNFAAVELAPSKQPRYVIKLSWDDADTDYTYLTSSEDANVPTGSPAVDRIDNAVLNISGQTQKINPDISTSTIGAVTIELSDVTDNSVSPVLPTQITARMNTKLDAGDGLRGKIVRVYVGYFGMPFSDYDLRLSYIIDSVVYRDGIYKIKTSDIQRIQKHKIFTPDETQLNITINETTLIIPVVSIDTTLFPAVAHGAEWSTDPSVTVGYIKIEDEVIRHQGGISFDTTNGWHITALERHVLNTLPAAHTVDSTTIDTRKPKIIEHIYLEGAAPKIIYAILTGQLLNGSSPEDTLPDHWHLDIDTSFVRLTDFETLGDDLWNTSDDSGKPVRIENPGTQDGKRYIEKEILLWMGSFMPIYSNGELGIRKLAGVLSDSSYLATLDNHNIKTYSDLTHNMRSVINDIRVSWNWVDSTQVYTKENLFIDAASISKHGVSDEKQFTFKTVHTGIHTDESMLNYFDVLRDRYSGPPLLLSLDLMPSMSRLEVGDIVRVTLDQIRDFNTGSTLDRAFEVQQVTTNWMTGAISVKLFGSSQAAGQLDRTTLTTKLLDTFYTQAGTELSTVLTIVAGHVTTSGPLTGHITDIDNDAAIYYYDSDLTIDAGVTVTITENVQLRIKGVLQVNGTISGVGNGATGGAATTQYEGGGTSDTYDFRDATYDPIKDLDVDLGEKGYFGTTITAASLRLMGGNTSILENHDYISTTGQDSIIFNANNTTRDGNVSVGASVVPFFSLENDQQTNTLTGYRIQGATYPGDFRGNSGAGGIPFMKVGQSTFTGTIVIHANGGAGGDGGAGLIIIARGMAFGGSGKIDLSGGDSVAGTTATHDGKTFYAGSGAPGAPGALVILLDGDVTNPDVTQFSFIANYGAVGYAGGATQLPLNAGVLPANYDITSRRYTIAGWLEFGWPEWPYSSAVYAGPPDIATQDISVFDAAHRIQYIPEDETPAEEVIQRPADVTGFSAVQNGDVVVFKWDAVPDVFNAGFEIRYAPQTAATFASATPLTEVTKGTSVTSAAVPPGDWTFYIVGVNDAIEKYSETPATSNLTVTNALDIISQTAQAPTWTGTLTNFVLHHTGVLVPQSQDADSSQSGNTDWDLDNVFNEFVHNAYETCTYESAEVDIGFDDAVRVWGDIESALGPLESGLADPKLSIDYRLAAGSYDGFESWTIGDLTARYFKHKLTLTTSVGKAYIKEFLPTVDVLEHTQSATGVTIAASGGTTITYPTPFHTAPFVRTFMTATSALIPVRSSVTSTSFLAQVFDSTGADVGGTIDWEATGS